MFSEEAMRQALRHYLLALQFFTRIPVTGRLAAWVGYSPDMLRASSAHFPGVGWVVGACAAVVYALLYLGLGAAPATPWVAAALSTAATRKCERVSRLNGITPRRCAARWGWASP